MAILLALPLLVSAVLSINDVVCRQQGIIDKQTQQKEEEELQKTVLIPQVQLAAHMSGG